ncbi:zf-CSL-domain-containing protein [Violaceomyces palustris]|uniref:Zf-CSL-domain-containing protein n=1 Tax=Violaceomyces palustris TaxID=1673888 RepID=A0ACD0NW41_9BASI|nr:zf-CSL-domain-containing protein [Violaceomyces palustris]
MPPKSFYDEIELEDMSYDQERDLFHFPCPCGDRFEITRQQLRDAEDIARCPSCSLIIRVVFDPLDFEDDDDEQVTPLPTQNPTVQPTPVVA